MQLFVKKGHSHCLVVKDCKKVRIKITVLKPNSLKGIRIKAKSGKLSPNRTNEA